MKVVYVAHPLGAGPERESNRARAKRWCHWVMASGHAPVADWILLAELEETDENRRRGLEVDQVLVARCDEIWLVGGCISPGMQIEAEAARKAGVTVVDMTNLGPEPPSVA